MRCTCPGAECLAGAVRIIALAMRLACQASKLIGEAAATFHDPACGQPVAGRGAAYAGDIPVVCQLIEIQLDDGLLNSGQWQEIACRYGFAQTLTMKPVENLQQFVTPVQRIERAIHISTPDRDHRSAWILLLSVH